MPRSGDDGWRGFPSSGPVRVDHGIASRKQRGAMADTWWSQRFVAVLESYGLGGRMQRGRRYARTGQVVSLSVRPGTITAAVQGSRSEPYEVAVAWAAPSPAQWQAVEAAFAARVGFVAQLLAGEVPAELEDAFAAAGVDLFPRRWPDIHAHCSCPDWGDPCKHMAAVLYVFADQLDDDPWLLLAWRGRSRDELLGTLRLTPSTAAAGDDEVAPWWPLVPGATVVPGGPVPTPSVAAPPDPPDRVLRRLGPLDAAAFGSPVVDHLSAAYAALVTADDAADEVVD